jgi:hypothetical protein
MYNFLAYTVTVALCLPTAHPNTDILDIALNRDVNDDLKIYLLIEYAKQENELMLSPGLYYGKSVNNTKSLTL